MKISELARRSGVPKETIHYYIREGVLQKPRKVTKNVADYDAGYIEQIRIIKGLQDNYFLPLSVIKKIMRQRKKQSLSEQSSSQLLTEYFRPLDRFLATEITGKEAFRKATGLGREWLRNMEKWGVITPEIWKGRPVYSRDNVILAKLMVDMDRIGFGPKNGYKPEVLKHISDFMREYVRNSQREFYQSSLERLTSEELIEKGSKFTEIMSLFFYHLYHKLVREEYRRLLTSLEEETRDRGYEKGGVPKGGMTQRWGDEG